MKTNKNYFLDNSPISKEKDDLFNFQHYAKKVQRLIQLNSDNSEPITIGIYGKWGEGKTSFLQLIESKIDLWEKKNNQKGILKYSFNPWRYSSAEEMQFDFFEGLSKLMTIQNNDILRVVGERIISLSRYLKAVKISTSFGIPKFLGTKVSFETSEVFKALGEDIKGKELSIESIIKKVDEKLEISNYKIVVFIDDIDRLDKEEIYSLLKLIKLNANFKNFIYLITLDENQIAKAIGNRYGKGKNDGKLFLEKIINIPIHLPRIERDDLKSFFENKLRKVFNNLDLKDSKRKEEEYKEILLEYWNVTFKTPREIIRILNSFFIDAFAIGDEVNLRDLFWIEVLKIKNGECYNYIKNYYNRGFYLNSEIIDFSNDITSRDSVNGNREDIYKRFPKEKHIVDLLFPLRNEIKKSDSPKQIKELRINYSRNFDRYFSLHVTGEVSNKTIFNIRKIISEENYEQLNEVLSEVFSFYKIDKAFFRLQNLVNTMRFEENKLFLIKYLLENIETLFPSKDHKVNIEYRERIISDIASNLSSEYEGKSDTLVFELCKGLSARDLAVLITTYKPKKEKEIEKLLVSKAKNLAIHDKPIYRDAFKNRLVVQLWGKYDKNSLQDYINETLIDFKSVKELMRFFAPYYNNEFFGSLSFENFKHLENILDVFSIYALAKKEFPNEKQTNQYSEDNLPDKYMKSSAKDNVEQFIFWYEYNNEKKLKFL